MFRLNRISYLSFAAYAIPCRTLCTRYYAGVVSWKDVIRSKQFSSNLFDHFFYCANLFRPFLYLLAASLSLPLLLFSAIAFRFTLHNVIAFPPFIAFIVLNVAIRLRIFTCPYGKLVSWQFIKFRKSFNMCLRNAYFKRPNNPTSNRHAYLLVT